MFEFEWDEAKSEATRRARGFDFTFASRIFEGPIFEVPDERFDYGEPRICATGVIEDHVFTVVYTRRGDVRRIISARPGTRKERHAYREIYG
jgi:uncharacterized protein